MSLGKEISAYSKLEVDCGRNDFTVLREKQVHGYIFLPPKVTRSWLIVVLLFLKEIVLREKQVSEIFKRKRQARCVKGEDIVNYF